MKPKAWPSRNPNTRASPIANSAYRAKCDLISMRQGLAFHCDGSARLSGQSKAFDDRGAHLHHCSLRSAIAMESRKDTKLWLVWQAHTAQRLSLTLTLRGSERSNQWQVAKELP